MRDTTQREKGWDDSALVAAGVVAVSLFLGGYGLACMGYPGREERL